MLPVLALSAGLMVAAPGSAHAIIGGENVSAYQYPYFTSVIVDGAGGGGCGGTVIAASTILTAAHCVDEGVQPSQVTAYILDIRPEVATSITLHPVYDGDVHHGHDLAVLRFAPGATNGALPVQVGAPWTQWLYGEGTPVTIVGHGWTTHDGQGTTDLQALNTSIRSDSDMDDVYNRWWTPDWWISRLMIGAGNSDHTTCLGDSGGGLVVQGTNPVLVGVSSMEWPWPTECSEAAGFAEVNGPQLAWIASEVPQIVPGWGTCTLPSGTPGITATSYRTYQFAGGQQDGSRWWELSCLDPNPPGSPAPPDPPAPPQPPWCDHNPRCVEP